MEKFRRLGSTTLEARLLDLSERRSEAQQNSEQAQQQRKRRYDKSHRHVTFTPGQYVWLRRQEPITDGTTKLAPTYKGPYQIIAQKTPVTYEIRLATNPADNSSRDERVAHSSQLKVFRSPTRPFLSNICWERYSDTSPFPRFPPDVTRYPTGIARQRRDLRSRVFVCDLRA
ncbi:hypothetical protein HPB47_013338 [Ixodes persulcatus]|uniref:Uncharacterized protein n=1 Tax=Ixodes persulcatus TaxID=34615 RepID=A0AC60QYS2_IXOPE|nr:hypothetical protein HPB47_013338 [Ixodes persulcatus]